MSQYESHHFGVENARRFSNRDLSAKKSHYLEAQNAPLFFPSTTSLPNSISDRTAGLYMGARHDRRSATQPNTTKTIFPQYCSPHQENLELNVILILNHLLRHMDRVLALGCGRYPYTHTITSGIGFCCDRFRTCNEGSVPATNKQHAAQNTSDVLQVSDVTRR
jgi:hypothetical protein